MAIDIPVLVFKLKEISRETPGEISHHIVEGLCRIQHFPASWTYFDRDFYINPDNAYE